jgi:hypothetical protein
MPIDHDTPLHTMARASCEMSASRRLKDSPAVGEEFARPRCINPDHATRSGRKSAPAWAGTNAADRTAAEESEMSSPFTAVCLRISQALFEPRAIEEGRRAAVV